MNELMINQGGGVIEQVVINGDLSKLNERQRVDYYRNVCESVGLNPFTKPFDYIRLNGKLTLYAKKDATEQLRKLNGVSVTNVDQKIVDDLYIVTVAVSDASGRTDSDVGAVTIGHLKGDAKANAIMKAITKAKRRATLSICGLGWLDETELETIPSAAPVQVDTDTGEIMEGEIIEQPRPEPQPQDDGLLKKKRREFHAVGVELYGDEWDDKRPQLVKHVSGGASTSSNDLTYSQLDTLVQGMRKKLNEQPAQQGPLVEVEIQDVPAYA